MQNIKLKIEFINAIRNAYYKEEYESVAPAIKRIRYIGYSYVDSRRDDMHYNGHVYDYVIEDQDGISFFSMYYNLNNGQKGQWDFIWGTYLNEWFPDATEYTKESIFKNITVETYKFLCDNVEPV